MSNPTSTGTERDTWPALSSAALRVMFGIIWMVNAAFTWMPSFAANYAGYLRNAAEGQPAWSAWWSTCGSRASSGTRRCACG